MKQEPSFFDDCEPALVYIGRRLKDALKAEELLTREGFDYGVEADNYRGGFIFQTERVGAFFYVRPEAAAAARDLLAEHGFHPVPKELQQ